MAFNLNQDLHSNSMNQRDPSEVEDKPQKTLNEKQQENHELLIRCIVQPLGFQGNRPITACIIYKCLLQWRSFEVERTSVFDRIIQTIGHAIEVWHRYSVMIASVFGIITNVCENWYHRLKITTIHWLIGYPMHRRSFYFSNAHSKLVVQLGWLHSVAVHLLRLCLEGWLRYIWFELHQHNVSKASCFIAALNRENVSINQSFRGAPQGVNLAMINGAAGGGADTLRQVEAKYPALLFKQQLTAYVEKIYGMIRDNLKKEISPPLGLCIQVLLTLITSKQSCSR